jgi:hypothetical protein
MTYIEQARQRWPDRHVSGAGSIAVIPLDDKTCRLFVTRAEAQQVILNSMRVMVVDLDARQGRRLVRNFSDRERDPK